MDTNTHNERSSFTADSVAYWRTFTSIPYSNEIFKILEKIQGPMTPEAMRLNQAAGTNMIPYFEARYLLTNRELAKSGITQVLELAGGLSPRGFVMAENPKVTYVELDLPGKKAAKEEVINQLRAELHLQPRKNLFLEEGNVVSASDFGSACRHFKDGPIAVICEGLLRYISFADKEILAWHIYNLLKRHGGMWITPDIEILATTPARVERYERMAKQMGVDVRPNLFTDVQHAHSFFEKFGFKITECLLTEVADQLVSPERLGIAKEAAELSGHRPFVMTL